MYEDDKKPVSSGETLPFCRIAAVRPPAPVAEAALDWLAERAVGRPPASPAETVEAGELGALLGGAAAATLVWPAGDVAVLVREFADGMLDALHGRLDETGTLVDTRRTRSGAARCCAAPSG